MSHVRSTAVVNAVCAILSCMALGCSDASHGLSESVRNGVERMSLASAAESSSGTRRTRWRRCPSSRRKAGTGSRRQKAAA